LASLKEFIALSKRSSVSSYLALQNDSAGDLQNHRVHAIHGRRIRVGPGSARPSLHGRGASDAGPDLRAPASMEGEGPMPPWICAPGALGRCHQWWGEVERSRGPCWSPPVFPGCRAEAPEGTLAPARSSMPLRAAPHAGSKSHGSKQGGA
jgi:hypothetical protein